MATIWPRRHRLHHGNLTGSDLLVSASAELEHYAAYVDFAGAVKDAVTYGKYGVLLHFTPNDLDAYVAFREHGVEGESVAGVDFFLFAQVEDGDMPNISVRSFSIPRNCLSLSK